MTRRPLLAPITVAFVATLALAGCTTGGFAGSPAAGASASASVSASSKPAAKAAFVIPTNCLGASEVSALLGLPENGPTVTASPGSLVCEYLTATEDGAIIDYETEPGLTPATLDASVKSNPPDGATVAPLAHLGDAAYEVKTGNGESILVLTGSTLIDIAGGETTLPRIESLALDVLAG